jgi:hypothetical protein
MSLRKMPASNQGHLRCQVHADPRKSAAWMQPWNEWDDPYEVIGGIRWRIVEAKR